MLNDGNLDDSSVHIEKPETEFCCRLCGSSDYRVVRKESAVYGEQDLMPILYHVCRGCSVHFHDPVKFSRSPPLSAVAVKNVGATT